MAYLKKYGLITLGAAIYAFAFNAFYASSSIAFGGVTGIAQLINSLVPVLPVGMLVIVFNVPLFLAGGKLFGREMLLSSIYAMTISSLMMDWFADWFTFAPLEDTLLSALAGGAMLGLGLGIIFLQGATTGGTEIVARLLKLKLSWLPMGRLLLLADLFVITGVALVFRKVDTALYGVVALFVSTTVMDKVLYGMDTSKVAYIISDHPDEIARSIFEDLNRSVTFLEGEGGYTGQKKKVILCAFKDRQIVPIKAAIRRADPEAFLIVTNAQEILGKGFHSHLQNEL